MRACSLVYLSEHRQLASDPSPQGDALIQVYHNVVAELEFKLNKLKIAHIAVAVSSRYVRRRSVPALPVAQKDSLRLTRPHARCRAREPLLRRSSRES